MYNNAGRSDGSNKRNVEIITNASAGRALCGIYCSFYQPSKTAGSRLLLEPTKVSLSNPCKGEKEKILRFATKEDAEKYLKTIESSISNLDLNMTAGFQGLIKVGLSEGKDQTYASDQLAERQTTNASALHYIWVPKKAFQIEHGDVNITPEAKEAAISILKPSTPKQREKFARRFLERFGSHYPAGVQTLGGAYFSVVEVEGEETTSTKSLSKEAVNHLKGQIRVNCPIEVTEIGANASGGYTDSTRTETRTQGKNGFLKFHYHVTCFGPTAKDPDAFHRQLSDESTWALIDRGRSESFIPVWELLKNLGDTFEKVSALLEEIWDKDESERKLVKERDREKKEKAREKKQFVEELESIQTEHFSKKVRKRSSTI